MHIFSPTERIQIALQGVYGIALLSPILDDEPAQAVLSLLHTLALPEPDPVTLASSYSHALRTLTTALYCGPTTVLWPDLADVWQAYLVARLLDTPTIWNTQVEARGADKVAPVLKEQVRKDLRVLQRLFELDATTIWRLAQSSVAPALPALSDAWVPWSDLAPITTTDLNRQSLRATLAHFIATAQDWSELVKPLEHYWLRQGTGLLAHYRVLRWDSGEKQLSGIAHPDSIQLINLVGQEKQQQRLRANIERFLADLPAHDILLYGTPGTGKSSTIKALVNAYADQGLRLVELRKEDINDLPLAIAQLRGRAPHYLFFIDDLSFEEHETEYKVLKVLLEGTAEARPRNVLICATSNRINLVRESFHDRGKPTEDVNWRDTMDEKQSLSHRFGLRVTFFSPDQQQYLNIVRELSRQRQLPIADEDLTVRALQWERQFGVRSGRVARQFIDDLEADLGQRRVENLTVSAD